MVEVLLFLLGAAAGSFLNVLAVRYEPDRFLLKKSSWSGRSFCPHCRRTLTWTELIPLVSYFILRARCRDCSGKIAAQYPLAEILAGAIAVGVPWRLQAQAAFWGFSPPAFALVSGIIIAVLLALLLISLIDLRLQIIPDELVVTLFLLAAVLVYFLWPEYAPGRATFLGGYSLLGGFGGSIIINRLAGALLGAGFLFALFLISRGRGLGFGDVKLAAALGAVFGWPEIAAILFFAFVAGSLVGLGIILFRRGSLKSVVPFGPFLALGTVLTFFAGPEILAAYFRLFGL